MQFTGRAFDELDPSDPLNSIIHDIEPAKNGSGKVEYGNELGGVPVVLRDAPLGTYLGWNITADGFHKGKLCNYEDGMIAFAKTKVEREANGDPRLSLEERYGNHAGYVAAVTKASCCERTPMR